MALGRDAGSSCQVGEDHHPCLLPLGSRASYHKVAASLEAHPLIDPQMTATVHVVNALSLSPMSLAVASTEWRCLAPQAIGELPSYSPCSAIVS